MRKTLQDKLNLAGFRRPVLSGEFAYRVNDYPAPHYQRCPVDDANLSWIDHDGNIATAWEDIDTLPEQ